MDAFHKLRESSTCPAGVDPGLAPMARAKNPSQTTTERWEKFAHDDPYTYILTSLKRPDPGEFWQSGERTIQTEIVPLLQACDVRPFFALELGCGIGRLAVPLARRFRQVLGTDISPCMVERATSYARDNAIENVSFVAISGPEDLLQRVGVHAGNCDLVYSLLVFQHIPDFSTILGYLHVIQILLHERGLAYVQFDTRPKTAAYGLKTRLPDFALPRFWRRGIRRIRRSPEEIEAALKRANLEVVAEFSRGTAYHRYLLRCPQHRSDAR
jgi:SAM-dependent methyltransferase